MATKKQRRRREKGRRHEYEYVYVDDSGQEVEVDEADEAPKEKPVTSGQKPTGQKPTGQKAKTAPAKSGERTVEPPSWNKVARRGLIFAPFILIFFYITRGKGDSTTIVLLRTLPLVILLVPFMYMVDSFAYRSYQKRLAKRAAAGSTPKKK
ncbi:MAG TPA: hypothetical protein VHS03_06655 [Gaiellaceae bacterium]|nr:hypothetical protein [Gaiellaceae bacterium]